MAISKCRTWHHFLLMCKDCVLCQSAQSSRLAENKLLAQQQILISGSATADTQDKLPHGPGYLLRVKSYPIPSVKLVCVLWYKT